jgi:two-component system OmpR family response regulator
LKILVIEDEQNLLEVIRDYLLRESYDVITALNGVDALKAFEQEAPDFIITDLMLPDISGEEITAIVRKTKTIPIIMLTAKSQTEDRINGLTVGADDYITKPFSLRELVLRVKNLEQRVYGAAAASVLSFPAYQLKIDKEARTVFIGTEEVLLTKFEFDLLLLMASNPNRTYTREQLIESTAGYDYFGYDRTIDTHIKNLRKKLDQNEAGYKPIKTVYGVGYKFNDLK